MARAHFGSDNVSGIAPEILEAIAEANEGGVDSYGSDALTERLNARFANAVAALDCSPAKLTWKSVLDVLSFGATKNGCMAVGALIVFGEKREQFGTLQRLCKRAGQLYSKMCFFSAQLEAYLEDDHWIRWADHANKQAAQ